MIEQTRITINERNRRMTVGHINDLRAASEAGTATDFPAEAIMVACAADPDQRTVVVLGEHDTAWNPTSTKKSLTGPGQVTYQKHADGGYTATERTRKGRA